VRGRIGLPRGKGVVCTGATLIFLALLGAHREMGLLAGCGIIMALSFKLDRDKLWAWPVAMAISWTYLIWNRASYSGYNLYKISVLGVSILPVLAWPYLLMLFYVWVFPFFQAHRGWRLWIHLTGALSVLIIAMEVLGYHVFGIRLDSGIHHPGWPVLDIFHCPGWMTACYFGNAMLFCAVLSLVTCRRRKLRTAAAAESFALEPAEPERAA